MAGAGCRHVTWKSKDFDGQGDSKIKIQRTKVNDFYQKAQDDLP